MKIGRNDLCFCGSKVKYKYCHGKSVSNEGSIHERNLKLLDIIDELFSLKLTKNINEIKKNISNDKIKKLYEGIKDLWHFKTDIIKLLPKPDNTLRALYLGDVYPEMIIRNVIRFSLYSDKILIVSPFQNPWSIRKEYNPSIHPELFREDTLKLIHFMNILDPWIRSGIVELIPDPGDFDHTLRMKTYDLAIERSKDLHLTNEDIEYAEPYMREHFERYILNLPKEILTSEIKGINPTINEKEITDILNYMNKTKENDPFFLADEKEDFAKGQLHVMRSGANLEMGLYICQLFNAFPYTNMPIRWKEILSAKDNLSETSLVWTPLTNAFQKLDFSFLNNLDPNFAYSLRDDGRLESFRNFLRKVWKTVGGTLDASKIESTSRDFADELTYEYQKADEEWKGINNKIKVWFGSSIANMASTIGAVITGNLSFGIPTLGFGLASVSKLLEAKYNKDEFRGKVPMSVFIDLSKKNKII